MEVLFDNGKGSIFQESLKWLDSKHEHLQLSGALALGNFARSGNSYFYLQVFRSVTIQTSLLNYKS